MERPRWGSGWMGFAGWVLKEKEWMKDVNYYLYLGEWAIYVTLLKGKKILTIHLCRSQTIFMVEITDIIFQTNITPSRMCNYFFFLHFRFSRRRKPHFPSLFHFFPVLFPAVWISVNLPKIAKMKNWNPKFVINFVGRNCG